MKGNAIDKYEEHFHNGDRSEIFKENYNIYILDKLFLINYISVNKGR